MTQVTDIKMNTFQSGSNGSAGIEGAEKAEGERSRADLHGPQDRGEDKTRIRGRIDRRRIRAHQRNKIIVQARIGLLRSEKAVRALETRLAVLTGCSHAKRHFQFLTPFKEF